MKKKTYTKYDYYCIQTKIGNIAGLFALAAVSAALLMGAVAAGVHDYRQDGGLGLSSWLCLAVFALSLPMIVRNVKGYRNLQKKLREQSPEEVEKDPDFKVTIQTTRQVWGAIVALGILAGTTLAFSVFSIWFMIAFYDTDYLILFIFCFTLTLPSLAMMIAYIRLLPMTKQLEAAQKAE